MSTYFKVARVSDIPDQTARRVEVEGRRIALFNLSGQIYALADACTHQGGPLSQGQVEDDQVICPWHAARFDIRTGRVMEWPAPEDVRTYPVRVVGDDIEVEL